MARIVERGYSYDDILIVPKYNSVLSRKDVKFNTKVTKNYSIDMPFLAANMDTVCESRMAIAMGKLGGLGVIHRFLSAKDQANEILKVKEQNFLTAAAIGVKDYLERAPMLIEAGAKILVLDIAHGHSKLSNEPLDFLKKEYPDIDIMMGNIATKQAAEYFLAKGADAIKVGIGPGSACTTRVMTGAGVPQVTAIMNAFEAVGEKIPICADGGIKSPGDVTKAIGAGASTVMMGSVFSACDETPGEILEKNGQKYKVYRGMASFDATLKKKDLDGKHENVIHIEGESFIRPYRGPVEFVVKKYLAGLASGMTYNGAQSIDEIKGKVDFIEISSAGMQESVARARENI